MLVTLTAVSIILTTLACSTDCSLLFWQNSLLYWHECLLYWLSWLQRWSRCLLHWPQRYIDSSVRFWLLSLSLTLTAVFVADLALYAYSIRNSFVLGFGSLVSDVIQCYRTLPVHTINMINPLNPELNPICYLLALLAHHFLHVSRIRVKTLSSFPSTRWSQVSSPFPLPF